MSFSNKIPKSTFKIDKDIWIELINSKELKAHEINCVLFHDPCSDGKTAELAVRSYMKKNNLNHTVEYYPVSHSSYSRQPNVTGKNVLIADFSYKKDILNSMIQVSNKLLIIDHHKSTEKDLIDIDDKYKIFDMNHSGAMLVWKFLFPKENSEPHLVKYVQDRDIWTKKLPFTDAFASWFFNLDLLSEVYEKYLDDNLLLSMIETKGIPYHELNMYYIKQASNRAVVKFMEIHNKYYMIAFINSTVLKSDIGNYIFLLKPYIDFATVYSINDYNNSSSFSLRSNDKYVDVSEVAFTLSGGGHRNASGVSVSFVENILPGKLIDIDELYNGIQNVYFKNLEIDDKIFNVVYMNSQVQKIKLGLYLLQTKFFNKNNVDIQTANAIYFTQNNIDALELIKSDVNEVNIAAIWYYDGVNKITKFTIIFNKNMNRYDRKLIQEATGMVKSEVKYDGFIDSLIPKKSITLKQQILY